MAVVGLDMGNFSSYVGVARAGGVEIIANEYSDRLTPTSVTFDKSSRSVGQASKAMEVTNAKNTICNFKRLLGRRYQDAFVRQERDLNAYSIVEGNGGTVNVEVNYLNDRKRFTPEQIAAMMFTKLKDIVDTELGTKAVDCVISVPCFFTDAERRAMLHAAYIAGWNCLRLLNETTAVALCYGIYKGDLPEQTEKPRLVAFVDMGYTATQASIVAFNKGKLKMVATSFDPSLGGRDFDRVIMDAMRDEYQQRYRVDSYGNIKAKLRLRAECEKAKKSMSSNVQPIPIALECFIDEKDVSGIISRTDFEALAKPLLDRLRTTLEDLLKESQISLDDLDSVEIVGGSTRIPSIKQIVHEVFRQPPMTTMNADESVARGCTLMCAILSPTCRVKEFKIEDCQPYPITLSWQGAIDEDNEVEVFSRWSSIPSTKMLAFYKREPLHMEARYSYPNDIPFAESRIGQYIIEQIQPQPDGRPSKVKVKARLNPNGMFDVTQAVMLEDCDEPADSEATEGRGEGEENEDAATNESMEDGSSSTPSGPGNDQQDDKIRDGTDPKKSSAKPVAKKRKDDIELPITSRVAGVAKSDLDRLRKQELDMIAHDKQEKERSDARNAVEEYVYDMRGKVDGGEYEKYSDDKTRQKLLHDLRSTEDWLYDQGTNQDKTMYLERLKTLKTLGDPIRHRYSEAENRQHYMHEFIKCLQRVDEAIQVWRTKSSDRYSHIEKSDIEKVHKILLEKQKWYDQTANRFHSLKQHEDPKVLCAQIKQERDALEKECWTILNRPKPKPKVEPSADGPPASSNKKSSPSKNKTHATSEQQASMDID